MKGFALRITCHAAGLLVLCALVHPIRIDAEVWRAEQAWNLEWENRYADWIAGEVEPDFLNKTGLQVDCADLCYVIRAVFARMNALPYLASDRWGKKIGHNMSDWDSLPTTAAWRHDRRFLAFLHELVQHVTTRSFPHDTYPVALQTETVRPGLVVFENLIASHSSFIGRVDPASILPVVFFESSVPPSTPFKSSTITDVYIYPPRVSRDSSGVVRWNWPIPKSGAWILVSDEEMPFYSTEIYDASFPYRKQLSKALNLTIKRAVAKQVEFRPGAILDLADHFEREIQFRSQLVHRAQVLLRKPGGRLPNDAFDYEYNTDARDQRLFALVRTIWSALDEYDIPREELFHALESRLVIIDADRPAVNLLFLFIAVDLHWIDPDAYLSAAQRWGMRWDETAHQWIFDDKHTSRDVLSWYLEQKGDRKESS